MDHYEASGGRIACENPVETRKPSETIYGGHLQCGNYLDGLETPGGGLRYPDAEVMESGTQERMIGK
jgi:hypothetical protein